MGNSPFIVEVEVDPTNPGRRTTLLSRETIAAGQRATERTRREGKMLQARRRRNTLRRRLRIHLQHIKQLIFR